MIHCTPVAESERSSWIVGIAIATIVWSMKVIETAKIIAARISLLFLPLVSFMAVRLPSRAPIPAPGFDRLAAAMPPVFWIGLGIAAFIFLVGAISGARSRTAQPQAGRRDGRLPRRHARLPAAGHRPRHQLAAAAGRSA